MSFVQKHRGSILAAAVGALFVSQAGAQTTPTFKISIGVRESGSTAAIGDPATSTAGGIELINKDGQTLTADGSWQKFTFHFGTDPVANFSGGNSILDGTRGTFEHLRFLNSSGTTDQITMLVDDIVNTVGGTDMPITGYEEFANNATATFLAPNFSGSTSANLVAGGTSKVIDTAAHTGSKSYQTKFQFVDGTATRYVRFTTSQSGTSNLKANPTIDFTAGNTLSFWLNATVPATIVGWNTDTDGNWSDASKWAGTATTGNNIPDTSSEIARFLTTSAPRTVTVDQDYIVNGLNFNSTKSYTVAGTNKLTLNSPTQSGIDGSLVVQAGSHVISAPLETRVRVAASISAGASLKTGGIRAVDATGNDTYETTSFTKTGDGSYETGYLRYDTATISAGTVKITADGTAAGTSELNTLTFAGGVTPTSKLDITNNAVIVDYDTAATTPRPTPFASVRARIINGYSDLKNWSGNGITSSTAAANSKYAIGYAEASALGLTTFVGRAVDAEAVVLRFTLKGDADLSGNVNFDDLIKLAQNYNGTDKLWTTGDFNYDGNVNFDDLISLAQNYNQSLSASQINTVGSDFAADFALARSLVPEPTTIGVLASALTLMTRRRRA